MPKQKTRKGMKKRFKLTASGKVKYRKAGRGHLLSHKSEKRKRQLRKAGILRGPAAEEIREGMQSG